LQAIWPHLILDVPELAQKPRGQNN
jgi:hypothetical protein